MAHEAGIPVIAYDRLIRDCDLDLYVSFDNVRVGELQAQYLLDQLPRRARAGSSASTAPRPTTTRRCSSRGRTTSSKPLSDRGDIEVVHEDWADDWKPENAKSIVNAAITAQGRRRSTPSSPRNDGTAGGAIQALTEEGLAGKVLVTGQDAELVACQRIVARHAGDDHLQAAQAARQQRRRARREAGAGARSSSPARPSTTARSHVPSLLLDVVTVTRDNIADTVIKDGFHPYDEVYRGLPEASRPPRVPAQP